jgi:hypothetical protein
MERFRAEGSAVHTIVTDDPWRERLLRQKPESRDEESRLKTGCSQDWLPHKRPGPDGHERCNQLGRNPAACSLVISTTTGRRMCYISNIHPVVSHRFLKGKTMHLQTSHHRWPLLLSLVAGLALAGIAAWISVPLHRTGRDDGPRGRYPGLGEGSDAYLHRIRHRRLWKSTDGGNTGTRSSTTWRTSPSAPSPSRRPIPTSSTWARASQQPPELVHRRRRVGHHRRRQDLDHLGLENVQSIGRIVVDPDQPEHRLRRLARPSVRTQSGTRTLQDHDGGKTWKNFEVYRPRYRLQRCRHRSIQSPDLYASSFQRRRTWWGYNGGGPGCALWKSTDAGATWTKLDGPGWPKPKDGIYGRIAISIFKAKPTTIYAQVEAGASLALAAAPRPTGGPQPRATRWLWRIRR